MDITKQKDLFVILIAILWFLCLIFGTSGQFVLGMCLAVVMMFLYVLLGVAKNGVVSKKFLFYPLVIWAILWIVSFILSGVLAARFTGTMPSFTFLGLHPSFAPTVFLYWIGGQLTLNLGLYLYQDEWLSESEWDDFCKKVHAMKDEEV